MAIFRHPDGSYHRYPPSAVPAKKEQAEDEYSADANWRSHGTRPGIEIHRDGKTMRNKAPAQPVPQTKGVPP